MNGFLCEVLTDRTVTSKKSCLSTAAIMQGILFFCSSPMKIPPLKKNIHFILFPLARFSGVRVARSLVVCVVFCRSLFVPLSCFHLTIVLYVFLRFTNSDYPFGIFKLFFLWKFLDQLDFHDHKIEVIT